MLGGLRNAGNLITPPSAVNDKSKAKARAGEVIKPTDETAEKQKKIVHIQEEPARTRIVSAPSPARRLRQSAIRASSGPPPPSTSAIGPSSSLAPTTISTIEEEEQPSSSRVRPRAHEEDSIDLAWALRSPSRSTQIHQDKEHGGDFTMEEMRREIANLQLDMLRMGRNLKVGMSLIGETWVSLMHGG